MDWKNPLVSGLLKGKFSHPILEITCLGSCREPDKLRIFVNYALKTPEYECLSNFNRITYCCHFSAYACGFVLFRTYESRSGDAEFGR